MCLYAGQLLTHWHILSEDVRAVYREKARRGPTRREAGGKRVKTSDLQYSSEDDSVESTLAHLEARKKSRHSGKRHQQPAYGPEDVHTWTKAQLETYLKSKNVAHAAPVAHAASHKNLLVQRVRDQNAGNFK